MIKANTSTLKANLSKYLQSVREGREVVVTDRKTPIARLVPMHRVPVNKDDELTLIPKHPSAPRPGDVAIQGIRYRGTHSTDDLRQDRARR